MENNEYWRSSQNGEYKFSNCKFRSEFMISMRISRCSCEGGDYNDSGYTCSARNLFKVVSDICKYCWIFEHK